MQIDGYTRLAAVIADPIKHSLSPFIHNSAFDLTGINGVYVAWEIKEVDLYDTLLNIKRYNMFGLNVSMPYKKAVIPFLDDLSPEAELIGAVNTIVLQNDQLIGYNTDGLGFLRSLKEIAHYDITNKTMVLLGSGGAATAVMAQCALSGLDKIIVFTKEDYIADTKAYLDYLSEETGVLVEVYPVTNDKLIKEKVMAVDIIVNATSIGMDGQSLPVPKDTVFNEQSLIVDLIYHPMETPFLAMAKKQHLTVINGLGMLLYQAAESFKLWTGHDMPTSDIWLSLKDYCSKEVE